MAFYVTSATEFFTGDAKDGIFDAYDVTFAGSAGAMKTHC
jgi:hypothetical protein